MFHYYQLLLVLSKILVLCQCICMKYCIGWIKIKYSILKPIYRRMLPFDLSCNYHLHIFYNKMWMAEIPMSTYNSCLWRDPLSISTSLYIPRPNRPTTPPSMCSTLAGTYSAYRIGPHPICVSCFGVV